MKEEIAQLTFEKVTEVTTHPLMLIALISVWGICLITYLVVGAISRAKSGNGKTYSKRMISTPNYWKAFFIIFLELPLLLLVFVIFPLWIHFIPN